MGASAMRMAENLAVLRTLADESLTTLKGAERTYNNVDAAITMTQRMFKFRECMKSIEFDWGYVPGEWDHAKKQGQK